jgi:hypothetical protein
VLSRGEHGLREARFLVNYTDQLWLVTHGKGHCDQSIHARLAGEGVRVVESALKQVVPSDAGIGLLFSDGEVLKLDESGYVEVDAGQQSFSQRGALAGLGSGAPIATGRTG